MTAQKVLDTAMALTGDLGTVDTDTETRAPLLIDSIQREIAKREGVETVEITSLEDELSVSDNSALKIMPYKLAAVFALTDRQTEMAGYFNAQYEKLLKEIPSLSTTITDNYDFLAGMQ